MMRMNYLIPTLRKSLIKIFESDMAVMVSRSDKIVTISLSSWGNNTRVWSIPILKFLELYGLELIKIEPAEETVTVGTFLITKSLTMIDGDRIAELTNSVSTVISDLHLVKSSLEYEEFMELVESEFKFRN